MSVTGIPSNNSSPNFFKILPKIILCVCVCIFVPIVLIYLSFKLILYSIVFLLNFILNYDILDFNPSFIKMIFPVVEVVLSFFILSIYLRKIYYILNKVNFGLRGCLKIQIIPTIG